MNPKTFGALAAAVAGAAVVLCVLAVVLHMPIVPMIVMIGVAVVLLAGAGALIGAAVAAQRESAQ